ncbi:hypothetical protein CB0940_03345 [Cercospora beticola]|uniref:Uncharacterized protein n=1 Tax=Cercospora beticola TaxID=122368 RepID=A0A2G5I2M9_CERBT|nr:hypothetical protein CB0940_03345 [Cercospora beticola]PIA99047.1 hypothetical protein CB0940_03345 [Cercospora beticola]WPB00520.1 hypothetical protein RHO25_005140 [Cercospora beticola]
MSPNDPSPRHPRSSTETERTLIADEEQHPASSSRAASPARTLVDTSTPTPYRGFPSQAEYLAALREWAEEKRYLQPSTTTLTGYYGKETLQAYANKPRHEFGISRKLREMKEKKQGRKQSVA